MLAGPGTEVDEVIGREHRALVVLHDDHGVAEVAQAFERRDQARVVALMQADRGLVEDVKDSDQRRPDLGGQPDPLCLAARQRCRRALERQVADAHVVEEAQPLVDLAQDHARDLALGVRQLELLDPVDRAPRRHARELVDAEPADLDRERLGPQPRAMALGTRTQRHVLLDLLPRPLRVRLAIAPLEVRHDALEGRGVRAPAAVAIAVRDVDPLAVRAAQEAVAHVLREVLPGLIPVDLPLVRDRLGHLLVVARGARRPGQDRPLVQRERRIRDDQLWIDLHLGAEAGAARTGAVRRVEREHARLELRHRGAAVKAHEALRVGRDLLVRDVLDVDDALRARHRGLDRVGEPLAQVGPHHEPVDDDRDVVLVLLVEDDVLLEPAQLAVHLHARESLRAQLLEELPVLALAPADDRREHHELGALRHRHHLVDDLLGGLRLDRAAAVVAVRMTDAGPQEAQVVVDLGDRADRRARVARGRLLVDRDGRREALDRVHVRLVHLTEELARVGRQRLDVAALALRVDRVEREARLARARQPRDHDQRVARQPQVEIPEVVLPRTRDDDFATGDHVR